MRHIIHFNFDKKTSHIVRDFWEKVGLEKDYPPHISLAVYTDSNEAHRDCLIEHVAAFSKSLTAFDFTFVGIGVFPTVTTQALYLTPRVTQDLLYYHKNLHILLSQEKTKCLDFYLPEKWVPHCTLADNISNQDPVEDIAQKAFELLTPIFPHTGKITSIEIKEISDNLRSIYKETLVS